MQSKKANLVIAVAKNVVEQYREQLSKSIEANKYRDLEPYTYENRVQRAERALASVDKILENFEQSVFDGEITEEATYQAIYTSKGRELKEMLYNKKPVLSDVELELALMGTRRIFKQIGIPEYSIYPIISDIMERTRESNYINGELDEEKVKLHDKEFNLSGKYKVGQLNINNILSTKVPADTGVLIYTEDTPYLYPQGKDLYLEVDKIKEIIDAYIEEEINEKKLESLEKQNDFVSDTFQTIRYVGTIGGGNSQDYSMYYYEHFRNVFDYNYRGGKDYYRVARPLEPKKQTSDFDSKGELQSLKQQKENLERLAQLTEEEKELNARLLEILEEKMRIVREISGVKVEEQPVMDSENPDRKYVSENEYIENGTHYHLPTFDKEPHVQLK
ncbi:MAG: hypothetical protein IJY25_04145 [Bacilli bacterium]|nr:hypothetical protein [Bacilli bacterium]